LSKNTDKELEQLALDEANIQINTAHFGISTVDNKLLFVLGAISILITILVTNSIDCLVKIVSFGFLISGIIALIGIFPRKLKYGPELNDILKSDAKNLIEVKNKIINFNFNVLNNKNIFLTISLIILIISTILLFIGRMFYG
jgi:hypothetical protein